MESRLLFLKNLGRRWRLWDWRVAGYCSRLERLYWGIFAYELRGGLTLGG